MKKLLRKQIGYILILLMFVMQGMSVSAQERGSAYNGSAIALHTELELRVKEAMQQGENKVMIDDLHIPCDDARYQVDYLNSISPYLSELQDFKVPYYDADEPYYAYITYRNPMTVSETEEYFTETDRAINEIRTVVKKGQSDADKALLLHDYLVLEYEYDTRAGTAALPAQSYNSGGLLHYKTGVCQSYAGLYMYILNQFDIECTLVSSDKMGHMWNYVKIDGVYYHTDVTWDDPTPDITGRAEHANFLLSDTESQAAGHHDWDANGIVCAGSYPDAYWKDATSAVYTDGTDRYFIRGMQLIKNGAEGEVCLYQFDRWHLYGTDTAYSEFNGSGLILWDQMLYFNTEDHVMAIRLGTDHADPTAVYALPNDVDGYIYGIRRQGQTLEMSIRKNLSEAAERVTCESIVFTKDERTFTTGTDGDVNEDSVTDIKDFMRMQKYLKDVIGAWDMAQDSDLSGDGKVDGEDLSALAEILCAVSLPRMQDLFGLGIF